MDTAIEQLRQSWQPCLVGMQARLSPTRMEAGRDLEVARAELQRTKPAGYGSLIWGEAYGRIGKDVGWVLLVVTCPDST